MLLLPAEVPGPPRAAKLRRGRTPEPLSQPLGLVVGASSLWVGSEERVRRGTILSPPRKWAWSLPGLCVVQGGVPGTAAIREGQ